MPAKIIVLKYNEILPAVSYHTMNGLALIRIFPSLKIKFQRPKWKKSVIV
ncbi:hypothetical protein AB434_2065 [Heyndrickxia coagulans]|uniref:Uncharacterized protein n=1 Tax=Heyndrickxia coagulans TaxID=1398 RepID=A0AAN0T785_HEYCO|nr:hypothetical protein SB48_HM08orf05216 [Heyndrickxia coagulans]AKN54470.1 hypothetical protein AB434_2065 [Heyndrickxia coagulans]